MDKFETLEEEKKNRILEAALHEFADQGFEKASTNAIVKRAGIGKGMLFYYFQNKTGLYHYLIDYSLHLIERQYFAFIDTEERDFIERMKKVTRMKWELSLQYPGVFPFISTLILTDREHMTKEAREKYDHLQQKGFGRLYENIDLDFFREDVSNEKLFHIVQYFLSGYETRLKNELKDTAMGDIDFEAYVEEFYEYLDILKITFYRGEKL